jgi:hypothetical protein
MKTALFMGFLAFSNSLEQIVEYFWKAKLRAQPLKNALDAWKLRS